MHRRAGVLEAVFYTRNIGDPITLQINEISVVE